MRSALRKLMALLCSAAITMTLLPAVPAMAAEAEAVSGTGVTMTAGSYKLTEATTLNGTQTLTGDLTVDLNGQTLTGTAAPFFKITGAYTLTITDSAATDEWKTNGGGKVQGLTTGGGSSGMILLAGKGTFNLEGGTLTGHVSTGMAGAIRASNGSTSAEAVINMTGGVITGNSCTAQGGAVMLYNNTMNMSGGIITANSSSTNSAIYNGAAIYVSNSYSSVAVNGRFNMSGGKLYGNTNTYDSALNADIHNRGEVVISGGQVGADGLNEIAVYNHQGSTSIYGDVQIKSQGVKRNAGTVYVGGLSQSACVHALGELTKGCNTKQSGNSTDGYVYTCDPAVEQLAATVAPTYLNRGGHVKLGGATTLNGTVTLTGDLTVDLAGQTLTATKTPVFKLADGAKLTITDSAATDAWKTNGGGKLLVAADGGTDSTVRLAGASVFNLAGGTLSGHTSTQMGGVVQTETDATAVFNMTGGVIDGNTSSKQGSVAMIRAGSAMTMSGGKITGNSGTYASGGDDANRNGAAVYISAEAAFTMTDGEISGNYHATYPERSTNLHNRGEAVISGGTIGAQGDAEAVYNLNSIAVITLSGKARILGGGLAGNVSKVTVGGLTDGARIISAKALTMRDETVKEENEGTLFVYTRNEPAVEEDGFAGDLSAADFAQPGEYVLSDNANLTGSITLPAGEYTLDLAGHTLTGKSTPFFRVNAGTTLILRDSVGGGKVDATASDNSGGNGTFYVYGGTFDMYGGTVTGRSSTKNAGGVRLGSSANTVGGTFNLYGGTISGNTASNGGGVLSYGGTVNVYGGAITENSTTSNGGGVWQDGNGTLNIYGGTVAGNTAKAGPNICNYGMVNISGGTVGRTGDANAIHAITNGAATISGSPVIGGGGITNGFESIRIGALRGEACVTSAGRLDYGADQTVVEAEDGGVYTYTAKALAAPENGVKLTADTVFAPGAVYYLDGDVALANKVTLTEGEYTVYLDGYTLTAPEVPYFDIKAGATLTVKDRTNDFGRILGKPDSANGLFTVRGSLKLEGGTVTGHTHAGSGTVIVYGGGTFDMSGGIISGNRAKYGGALYANGTQKDGVVTSPATVILSGGTVTGNTATTGGSALYMNAARFTMTGGRIFGNTVLDNGQAAVNKSTVRTGSATLDISGGIIGDESADSAAVYSVLVGTNSSVPSTMTVSGEARILGKGIKRQESSCTATVRDLRARAEVRAQEQLTYDAADPNVEEYRDDAGLWRYVKIKTLRVLSIGNSYSRDSFYYLTHLSQVVGMPIEAAYLQKDSATIRQQANLLALNPKPSTDDSVTDGVANDPSVDYSYYKANMNPASSAYGSLIWTDKVNVAYALADGRWDVVVIQDCSGNVGFPGGYNSDITYLADYIAAVQPDARLYWNMTWAYDGPDTGRLSNKVSVAALKEYYNNDQAVMYNAIVDRTAENFIGPDAAFAEVIDGWFPTGVAIQNLRGTSFGDNVTRDGGHLALGGGRLTAAMAILKTLRPNADLSAITMDSIRDFLVITEDSIGQTDAKGKAIGAAELDLIRTAVTAATADLTKAPAKLSVAKPVTVEEATRELLTSKHSTVAQAVAPLKLHFADVAALSDGTVVVSAYENVDHTPNTDPKKTAFYEFGYQGAGRLIVWSGDKTGSEWNFDQPLLVVDQKQLEEWGVVSLSDRYEKLSTGKLTATEYINFCDPRDPNVTVAHFDTDGDGDMEDVLLLTFWVRNFRANSCYTDGTFMTWSMDGGKTWAKAEKITKATRLKRGDLAVFDNGQILLPLYTNNRIYTQLHQWNGAGWTRLWEKEVPDFAPGDTDAYVTDTGKDRTFGELAVVVPNPNGDVVYGMIRTNGVVIRSYDRGATWELVDNEDGTGYETKYPGHIHQPGFAVIDTNRVFVTWARADYPRNTVGKVFEVNSAPDWTAAGAGAVSAEGLDWNGTSWDTTTAGVLYDMTEDYNSVLGSGAILGSNSVTGSRDSGDPSAELLADGETVLVVTYDTAYRAIVGTKVTVAQPKTVSGTVSASTVNANRHLALSGDVTLNGSVSVSGYRTVDLAGKTLNGNMTVPKGAVLVIDDSSSGKSGVFNGTLSGAGSIVISGGTFANRPEVEWLAKDAPYVIAEKAGKYQVKPGLAAADGSYVNFGSTLDMGVYLQGDNGINGVASYQVEASVGSADIAVDSITGKLLLRARGIPAKNMRDDITYTVKNGSTVYYTGTMSVYDAAYGWYTDAATDAGVKTLLADMLNFGDEARKALKDPDHSYTALDGSDAVVGEWSEAATEVTGDYRDKVAVTLSLKDNIQLIVYIDDEDAAISDVAFAGNSSYQVGKLTNGAGKTITRFTFGQIDMVNAKDSLSFTVTLSGGETFRVTTGIEEYVASTVGGRQSAVIQALQKYVDSVIRVVGSK